MGQQEVYNLLKRHRSKWFSTKEITDKLKISAGSVTTSLKKLRKAKIVNFRMAKRLVGRSGKKEVYVYKLK